MSIYMNGATSKFTAVYYNGVSMSTVYYNGVQVFPDIVTDTTSPSGSITFGSASVSTHSPNSVTIVFNEPVKGFTVDDIITSSGTILSGFSGSGTTYTLTATSGTDGTTTLTIGANTLTDLTNNPNAQISGSYQVVCTDYFFTLTAGTRGILKSIKKIYPSFVPPFGTKSAWWWGVHSTSIMCYVNSSNQLRQKISQSGTDTLISNDIKMVDNSHRTMAFITNNGNLYVMADGISGNNTTGVFGQGTTEDQTGIKQVPGSWLYVSVSDGISAVQIGPFIIAIKTDGTLWGWGSNGSNQLGLGDSADRTTPTQLSTTTGFIECYASGYHTLAKTSNGKWYAAGQSSYRQVFGYDGNIALISDVDGLVPNFSTTYNIKEVYAGYAHTMFITTDGKLYGCGSNESYDLGTSPQSRDLGITRIGSDSNWLKFAKNGTAMTDSTVAIKTDGSLWAWGENTYTGIGPDGTPYITTPTRISNSNSWIYASNASDYGIIAISSQELPCIPSATPTAAPTPAPLGYYLYATGHNGHGQLGLGDITDRSSPVQVGSLTNWQNIAAGYYHTIATKTDGTLWTWGYNGNGELGLGDTVYRSSPVQVGSLTNWQTIAAGGKHAIATKTDGTLWTWGYNGYGELGLVGRTHRSSPVQVGTLTNWQNIAVGYNHTIATKTDGTLWTWGRNSDGQLGLGDITDRLSPVQVGTLTNWQNIAAGYAHTIATKTDGTLWTWGYNSYGQLGLGDITHRSSPVQVGTLTNWQNIAAGDNHTIATKTDGTLWTWGYNNNGELGLGDTTHRSSPVQVGSLTNWQTIAAGVYHTIATKTNGTLWTWGNNDHGWLGLGDNTNRSSPVQVGTLTNWVGLLGCGHSSSFALTR